MERGGGERETEREKQKAENEYEFTVSARLHARKFDKDVVEREKRDVFNEVEVRIMRDGLEEAKRFMDEILKWASERKLKRNKYS